MPMTKLWITILNFLCIFMHFLSHLLTFVAIYALFPQIFWNWKTGSADFIAFRMYGQNKSKFKIRNLFWNSSKTQFRPLGFRRLDSNKSVGLFLALPQSFDMWAKTFYWSSSLLLCMKHQELQKKNQPNQTQEMSEHQNL